MAPPRWLLLIGWALHRRLFALSGGRIGSEPPRPGTLGTLFLLTVGRTTGKPRRNGLFYLEDDGRLVVVASNAGAAVDPGWLHNLRARPDAVVALGTERRAVRARAAEGEERERLWQRLVVAKPPYEDYARTAGREIAVVVLEPAGLPPDAAG